MTFASRSSVLQCVIPEVCNLETYNVQPTRCSIHVSLFSPKMFDFQSHLLFTLEPLCSHRAKVTITREIQRDHTFAMANTFSIDPLYAV